MGSRVLALRLETVLVLLLLVFLEESHAEVVALIFLVVFLVVVHPQDLVLADVPVGGVASVEASETGGRHLGNRLVGACPHSNHLSLRLIRKSTQSIRSVVTFHPVHLRLESGVQVVDHSNY
jgi:hypothetical protein